MAKRSLAATPATTLLSRNNAAFELLEYTHDDQVSDYGREAAAALDFPPEQIFKTLVVEVDRALAVAVVPVSGTLNLKAFAHACGAKKQAWHQPKWQNGKLGMF